MSENSKIEWTDHTFNPWIGCTAVSPGCAHCYAETQDRFRHWTPEGWGKGKPRKRTSVANWRAPVKWNRRIERQLNERRRTIENAAANGVAVSYSEDIPRPRVFCASLADWLADLLKLINDTPHLDWLLLTKRPENFRKRVGLAGDCFVGNSPERRWVIEWVVQAFGHTPNPPANVWIGTTVEDQTRAEERIPQLLQIPAKVRFLSMEPLLAPVDLGRVPDYPLAVARMADTVTVHTDSRIPHKMAGGGLMRLSRDASIHWVICGGESGPLARPMHPEWARSLRDQCAAAGVPFLFKQWGEWVPDNGDGTKGEWHGFGDGTLLKRVGKKAAGRLLAGVEHNAFPG